MFAVYDAADVGPVVSIVKSYVFLRDEPLLYNPLLIIGLLQFYIQVFPQMLVWVPLLSPFGVLLLVSLGTS